MSWGSWTLQTTRTVPFKAMWKREIHIHSAQGQMCTFGCTVQTIHNPTFKRFTLAASQQALFSTPPRALGLFLLLLAQVAHEKRHSKLPQLLEKFDKDQVRRSFPSHGNHALGQHHNLQSPTTSRGSSPWSLASDFSASFSNARAWASGPGLVLLGGD